MEIQVRGPVCHAVSLGSCYVSLCALTYMSSHCFLQSSRSCSLVLLLCADLPLMKVCGGVLNSKPSVFPWLLPCQPSCLPAPALCSGCCVPPSEASIKCTLGEAFCILGLEQNCKNVFRGGEWKEGEGYLISLNQPALVWASSNQPEVVAFPLFHSAGVLDSQCTTY